MTKTKAGPIHAGRLKSFIERIERLNEEKKAIQSDVKDVYSEAKGVGYDVATMRKVISLRAMDPADRAEQETLLDVYMHALEQPDRIDARLAAGESQRSIAAAEGVSKSTVQRRGPKVQGAPQSSEMDHPHSETGEREGASQPEGADTPASPPLPDPEREARSGTTIFAESANNESCGEPVSAVGATANARASDSSTAPLRPHDTVPCSLPQKLLGTFAAPATCAENAQVGDTRGEARPDPDGLDIPSFLRARAEA